MLLPSLHSFPKLQPLYISRLVYSDLESRICIVVVYLQVYTCPAHHSDLVLYKDLMGGGGIWQGGTTGEWVWGIGKEVRGILWWLFMLLFLNLRVCLYLYVIGQGGLSRFVIMRYLYIVCMTDCFYRYNVYRLVNYTCILDSFVCKGCFKVQECSAFAGSLWRI